MENVIKSDWLVAYTYPNAEKKISTVLRDREIISYLPLQKVVREWSRGKKELEVPLFPNYIFVNVIRSERWNVLSVPGIVRFLSMDGKASVVSESEINTIKRILKGNYEITNTCDRDFMIGDRVKVVMGPLTGLEGVLMEKKSERRFVVRLERIDKILSLNISTCSLTKLENIYQERCA